MNFIVIIDVDEEEFKALKEALPVIPVSEALRNKIKESLNDAEEDASL